jgi:hypothetical protein
MMKKYRFPLKSLFVHPCYTVGYGSEDHCNFPFYGLCTALYADGKPVRLANDRYEQFQSALKHAFSEQGSGWAKFVDPIRQVMVRGIKKVDQLFVLTMAAYNLVPMRTLGKVRPVAG